MDTDHNDKTSSWIGTTRKRQFNGFRPEGWDYLMDTDNKD